MARTCIWCGDPLPEPQAKGNRRREFCKPPKSCKQQHYLWHKQMKHDANMLMEPFWRHAYALLVEQCKFLEQRLADRIADLDEAQKRMDTQDDLIRYYKQDYADLQADYVARLKALGMSEQDIKEFEAYWQAHTQRDFL